MTYVSNSFSLGMLPKGFSVKIIELDDQPDLSKAVSVVGHADTAKNLGLEFNRQTVKLEKGDELFVAQYDGPRLSEGATTLPDGAGFRWFLVLVE